MAAAVQIPAEVYAAVEYQMRTAGSGSVNSTHFPIFENPRTAVAVVDVARPWSGKPQIITSVPLTPTGKPKLFKLNEATGSKATPVVCFKSVKAACTAKWLQTTPIDGSGLPRGVERMLLVLQIGFPGEGKDAILSNANGLLRCSRVVPLALRPLPAALAAAAQPRASFWVPGGGVHALG